MDRTRHNTVAIVVLVVMSIALSCVCLSAVGVLAYVNQPTPSQSTTSPPPTTNPPTTNPPTTNPPTTSPPPTTNPPMPSHSCALKCASATYPPIAGIPERDWIDNCITHCPSDATAIVNIKIAKERCKTRSDYQVCMRQSLS